MNKLLLLLTFVSFTAQGQWARTVVELTENRYDIIHTGRPDVSHCYVYNGGDIYVGRYVLSFGLNGDRLAITSDNGGLQSSEFFNWVGDAPAAPRESIGSWWKVSPTARVLSHPPLNTCD